MTLSHEIDLAERVSQDARQTIDRLKLLIAEARIREQDKRIAEQDKRIAEQDRRIAEQNSTHENTDGEIT